MKKSFLLFCITVFFTTGLFAQVQKYYRIKIFTNDSGLAKLASEGVTIDHGEYKKTQYFISEFSEEEFNIIKQDGFKYQVLINDMAAYYVSRNKDIAKESKENDNDILSGCKYATPQNFRLGTMGGFYTLNDLMTILDTMRLKYPNLISKKAILSFMTTAEGRKIYYVRISNSPDSLQNKPRILYTALHHAREPESLTQLIYYMWYLLENYNKKADITTLVNSCEMYFIPCVNPDGYVYNQTTNPNGGGFWRKNRRDNGDGSFGVDLNRNYGYKWGFDNSGSSSSTSSDTYRGPSAFSEPETQMLRDFCVNYQFKIAINNHTYSNVFIYPWGYDNNHLTKDSATFSQYAQTLTQCNNFQFGTPNQTVGYTANGTSDDWMYGDKTLKPKVFAMTAETGSFMDGFWPAVNHIIPLSRKNMDMNINAAKFAASFTDLSNIFAEKNKTGVNSPGITVYQNSPNPCKGITYIKYAVKDINAGAPYTLNIYNSFGMKTRTINLSLKENSVLINTADLQPGLYYYSISNMQYKSVMMKMMVIK